MKYSNLLTCLAIICGSQGTAATISAGLSGVGAVAEDSADTITGPQTVSVSEDFRGGLTLNTIRLLGNASASADSNSGELKAQVTKLDNLNRFGDRATANARMDETMTVTGDGTITFNVGYSGAWDVTTGTNFDVIIRLGIFDGQIFTDPNNPYSDAVSINNRDNLLSDAMGGGLSVTATVDGPKTIDLTTSLFASFGRGTGTLDFSNTAVLSFETTGNVAVNFADANFLSNAPGGPIDPIIPAVPLPAGLPLILTGFGFLGVLRLRQS